jgi:hypothetical protein
MASSEVKICNMALGRIGQSIFIDSLTERSQAANVCSVFFESCRDAVLADFPWNFATARAVLANLGTPPTNWSYRYALPSDCLTAWYLVINGLREPKANERIPFEVAEENDVRVLYTDQPEAELVYTKRVTNPNLFSPQFVIAFSWLLGSEISMPMSAASGLGDKAFKMYQFTISQAQATSLREGQADPERDCEFLSGRD